MRPKYTMPTVQRAECGTKPDYWYIRPRKPDGSQPRLKLGNCKTLGKRAAEKLRDEICRAINREPVTFQAKIPLAEFIDIYRETHLSALGPATQRSYVSTISKHILPALGAKRLCDFAKTGRADTQRWVSTIDGSKSVRQRCLNVLSSIFEEAIEGGYYVGRNPAKGVRPGQPTKPRRRLRSFTPAEMHRISLAAEQPLRVKIEVAVFCGLRIGEIRGLTPAALLATDIEIFQHIDQWTDEVLESAKDKEDRLVPCPAFLLEKLQREAAGKAPDELLWPVRYSSLQFKFKRLLRRLSLDTIGAGWHSLRSTYATLRDALGGTGLQAAMGHSSQAMTERYIRPGTDAQQQQVEAMVAAVYGRPRGEIQ